MPRALRLQPSSFDHQFCGRSSALASFVVLCDVISHRQDWFVCVCSSILFMCRVGAPRSLSWQPWRAGIHTLVHATLLLCVEGVSPCFERHAARASTF
jgi:hypothetical protein